jgi:ubiquinone biosynthesis protein COQ4
MPASASAPTPQTASNVRKPGRVKPLAALLAITRLLRNPQDTRQVFLLTEALRGRSGVAPFNRFYASPVGQQILAERRSLLAALSDRPKLAALPEGTLGRRYLAFMAEENLTAEGLVEVAGENARTYSSPDTAVRIFATRMRDMHDLYHVLAGYGRDELGEVCVLAFSYKQQKIRSFRVIAAFGALHVWRGLRRARISAGGIFAAVREASRHGAAASWLPGEDLETMLTEDLDILRQRLGILPPVIYQDVIARIRSESGIAIGPLSDFLGARKHRSSRPAVPSPRQT